MLVFELLYLLSATALAAYGFNSIFHCWLFWRGESQERKHQRSSQNGQELSSPKAASRLVTEHRDSGLISEHLESPLALNVQPQPELVEGVRGLRQAQPTVSEWLSPALTPVTVQLPIYNERHVASRLVEAVLALDWPANQLQIQVLDDSTDDTTQIVAATIARHWETDVHVEHIRRENRVGYKAGALEHGMKSATGEFIVIFDADFMPPADFLRETIPLFAEPDVGCIQTRWGHVNPETSLLTEAQALGIDGHFQIEQYVRNQIGAFLNFNGTAGAWRRCAMEAVGGWEHDTLTEDLDLSYRAQLGGWRIAYQNDIVVPAELPVQVDAFKRQQFRWAKGSLQTAIKLLGRLWKAEQPLWRKALGTLHLTNYLVHPFMVMNLLLLLPISSSQSPVLHIAPFLTTAAIGPPLMYWLAMRGQSASLWQKVRRLAILMALGTGLSLNNTKAAFEAFTGVDSEFKRTPKFAIGSMAGTTQSAPHQSAPHQPVPHQSSQEQAGWHESSYALPRNPMVWLELIFAIYAIYLLIYCIQIGVWWILIWVLMYAVGYGYIAAVAFYQSWQVRGAQAALQIEEIKYS